jgi:GMP synthase (glutamine-hydrolysing)
MAGTILVVQHVACETLGTIELALRSQGLSFRYLRVHEGDAVPPQLGDEAGLIVMGGPMSVYDHGRLPHLAQEMRLVESALELRRPVLGVCLGSQLLAHVLGARVYPGQAMEIGWHWVQLSPAAKQDLTWESAPEQFYGFHWHGDAFDLPSGATLLASSELTPHQAFRFGASAYGILFHMEVTASEIDELAAAFPDDLHQGGTSDAELRESTQRHLPQLSDVGKGIFGGWSKLAGIMD